MLLEGVGIKTRKAAAAQTGRGSLRPTSEIVIALARPLVSWKGIRNPTQANPLPAEPPASRLVLSLPRAPLSLDRC